MFSHPTNIAISECLALAASILLTAPVMAQELKARGTLRWESSTVPSAAFSPDGKTLASGNYDSIRLWNLANQKETAILKGRAKASSIAWNPDGKQLVTGGETGLVGLWDVATGKELLTFQTHSFDVLSLVFSLDGKTIATGGSEREGDKTKIKFWDPATGKEIKALVADTPEVFSVAFSPDGKQLAWSGDGDCLRLWDLTANREVARPKSIHTVLRVAFSPDSKRLAAGTTSGRTNLYDTATGKQVATFEGHRDHVSALAFSPGGKRLATGGVGEVILRDAATGQVLARHKGGSQNYVHALAFSPDGKILASGGETASLQLWDVK